MKKIVAVILSLVLCVVSIVSVSAGVQGNEVPNIKTAIADYEAANGTTVNTLRYYFLMPDGESGDAADRDVYEELEDHTEVLKIAKGSFVPSWYNDFTKQLGVQAGIYWWGAKDAPNPAEWIGYTIDKVEDSKNVYYADVPNVNDHEATTIIFNNAVYSADSPADPGFGYNGKTVNINTEGYQKNENRKNPNKIDNFDNMIYVPDPMALSVNDYSGAMQCGGNWMYYYGGDCYGNAPGGETDLEHNCLNEGPNHVHNSVQPETPTILPTAESTEPSPQNPPSQNNSTVTIYDIDGSEKTYNVAVGDKFTVYTYLNIRDVIESGGFRSIDAKIIFDSKMLRIISEPDEEDPTNVFPIIGEKGSLVYNFNPKFNLFNAVFGAGDYVFDSDDDILVQLDYEVIAEGNSVIIPYIKTLAIFVDKTNIKIIKEGEKQTDKNIVLYESLNVFEHKNHTLIVDEAVAPDCTHTGLTEGSHCSVCGEVIKAQMVIPANGHTPVTDEAVAPGCTRVGQTEGSHCAVCGEVLVAQEDLPATGHTPVLDKAVSPDCVHSGLSEGSHCSVCGEVLKAQETIPPTGQHKPIVDKAVEASCQHEGHTAGSHCEYCGLVYVKSQIIPKLPHTPVTDDAVAADCTHSGLSEGSHCSVCGETIVEQRITQALGHDYQVVEGFPATALTPGLTDGVQCSRCGEWLIEQEVIPKTVGKAILGDADGDGKVSVMDATAIQRNLADLENSSFFPEVADVDGDKHLSVMDATFIQRFLAELSCPEGIGELIG